MSSVAASSTVPVPPSVIVAPVGPPESRKVSLSCALLGPATTNTAPSASADFQTFPVMVFSPELLWEPPFRRQVVPLMPSVPIVGGERNKRKRKRSGKRDDESWKSGWLGQSSVLHHPDHLR